MIPLATAADLAIYTRGKITEDDPRAEPILEGVTAAIRAYCGWHVYPTISETVTLDGPGGRYLALPSKNVTAVSSVVENGATLTDTVDYRWSYDGSIRRTHRYWTDDYRAVEVTYTHGYQDAGDVSTVILAIASRQLASPMGATAETAGGMSVKWAETTRGVAGGLGILDHEYAILAPYRIESI